MNAPKRTTCVYTKVLWLTGTMLISAVAGFSQAMACDCPDTLAPLDELASSSVVIEAYIVSKSSPTDGLTPYRVAVNKVWKGAPMSRAIIYTTGTGTDCAVDFPIGKNYLIYAKGEKLEVGYCSRTFATESHAPNTDYQQDLLAFKQAPKGK